MKLLSFGKDGGPDSTVWGFWLIEIKSWFSIALLVFEDGSRDAYHEHAFNSVSWLLKGELAEDTFIDRNHGYVRYHVPGLRPIHTRRQTFHKVTSLGRSYVLTFRGPWSKTWREYLPAENRYRVLTNGRQEVA